MQGTVHGIVKANSDWQFFDVALKKKKKWTESQYPNGSSSKLIIETMDKLVKKRLQKKLKIEQHPKELKNLKNVLKAMFFVQYRGNIT